MQPDFITTSIINKMNKPSMAESHKYIDIERVIANKSPKLLKVLPRFVIAYLKRIVHEEEINKGMQVFGHLQGADFVGGVLKYLQVTYTIDGLDKLQPNERYLFASNHPLGGLDGMILIHALSKKFSEVKVPVNDLLMNVSQMHGTFIPVNKHGAQSKDSIRLMDETYASDTPMFTFPAGLCSRKQGGKIEDLEWKKNFIVKAVEHKRPIVPIYFKGRNSNFFYNLSRIRTFLGIKLNLEMLYLADEMFKQKGQKLHVVVGSPIHYSTFDATKKPKEWAMWVRQKVYDLSK